MYQRLVQVSVCSIPRKKGLDWCVIAELAIVLSLVILFMIFVLSQIMYRIHKHDMLI